MLLGGRQPRAIILNSGPLSIQFHQVASPCSRSTTKIITITFYSSFNPEELFFIKL